MCQVKIVFCVYIKRDVVLQNLYVYILFITISIVGNKLKILRFTCFCISVFSKYVCAYIYITHTTYLHSIFGLNYSVPVPVISQKCVMKIC